MKNIFAKVFILQVEG